MENLESQLKEILKNPLIYGVLAIFLTMYGPRLSPKPPKFVSSLFNSGIFRFFVMVLVIFLGSEYLRLALAISIVFLILMSIVNTDNIKEDFTNQVKNYIANYNLYESSHINSSEHFSNDIPSSLNLKCTVETDKSSRDSSRDSSPEPPKNRDSVKERESQKQRESERERESEKERKKKRESEERERESERENKKKREADKAPEKKRESLESESESNKKTNSKSKKEPFDDEDEHFNDWKVENYMQNRRRY